MLALPAHLALLLLSAPASALEPYLDWTLSAAGWSGGAETTLATGLRQPLWDDPDNPLLTETFVQAGPVFTVTPAYARIGMSAAFQPSPVFELRASASRAAFFGTFSAILPYADADAPYDDAARKGRDRTWGIGHRVSVQPTLRMAVGPLAVVGWSTVRWEDVHPALFAEDLVYWYQPELGLMVKPQDWTLDHNALALLKLVDDRPTAYVGVYGTARQAVGTGDAMTRVGPAAVVTIDHWTVYAIVQAYVESRTYTDPFPPFVAGRLAYAL